MIDKICDFNKKTMCLLMALCCFPNMAMAANLTYTMPVVDRLEIVWPDCLGDSSLYSPLGTGRPLARDSFGNLHLVYVAIEARAADTLGVIYYQRFSPSGIETPPSVVVMIDMAGCRVLPPNPSLEIDAHDNLHMIWIHPALDGSTIGYKAAVFDPARKTWRWPADYAQLLPDGIYAIDANFVLQPVEKSHILHVCYGTPIHDTNAVQIVYLRTEYRIDTGGAPEPVAEPATVPLSENYALSLTPKIAKDSRNRIYVTWMDNRADNFETMLRFGQEQNGRTVWDSHTYNVSESSAASLYPALAVDFNDAVHIIWNEILPAAQTSGLYYRMFQPDGKWAFAPEALFINHQFALLGENAIAISNRNDLHIIWGAYYKGGDPDYPDLAPGLHLLYAQRRFGLGWLPEWPIIENIMDPAWNVVTRRDARNELDIAWVGQTPAGNLCLHYGNLNFNDSPNPPLQIEPKAPLNAPYISDIEKAFESLSWDYSDLENDPMRGLHIQVADNPDFSMPLFNIVSIDTIGLAASDTRYTLMLSPEIFATDPLWQSLPDGIYFVRVRVADGIVYDSLLNDIIPKWSPWSKQDLHFRIDNTPPVQVDLTIGNLATATSNAIVSYENDVKLYLSAVDSIGWRVRVWGIAGHNDYAASLDTACVHTGPACETALELIVQLPPGDGVKHVFAEFYDKLAPFDNPLRPLHTARVVSDSIILDMRHLIYPDRDNLLFIPKAKADGLSDNDSYLFIPAGAVSETLTVRPLMSYPLTVNGAVLHPDMIPSDGNHPRIESTLLSSMKFIIQRYRDNAVIRNLRFNSGYAARLRIHYDPADLVNAGIDPSQEDDIRIFYWDGVNWVFLGGQAEPAAHEILVSNLLFLPSAPPASNSAPDSIRFQRPDFGLFLTQGNVLSALNIFSNLTVRPNPFTPNYDGYNDLVYFDFGANLRTTEELTIEIFDDRGYLVRKLDSYIRPLVWDGTDNNGQKLEGGIYFYQIRPNQGASHVGSLVLIR